MILQFDFSNVQYFLYDNDKAFTGTASTEVAGQVFFIVVEL